MKKSLYLCAVKPSYAEYKEDLTQFISERVVFLSDSFERLDMYKTTPTSINEKSNFTPFKVIGIDGRETRNLGKGVYIIRDSYGNTRTILNQ